MAQLTKYAPCRPKGQRCALLLLSFLALSQCSIGCSASPEAPPLQDDIGDQGPTSEFVSNVLEDDNSDVRSFEGTERNVGWCGAESCPPFERPPSPADCIPICTSPRVICAGRCVDLKTDAQNCGACGTVCSSGARCIAGACMSTWQRVALPPMAMENLWAIHGPDANKLLAVGDNGAVLRLLNATTAPNWSSVSVAVGMMDVKDNLTGVYVSDYGKAYLANGTSYLLIGTQGARTFPSHDWTRAMVGMGRRYAALAGVDPIGGMTSPEHFGAGATGHVFNFYPNSYRNEPTTDPSEVSPDPLRSITAHRLPFTPSIVQVNAVGDNGRFVMARFDKGVRKSFDASRILRIGTDPVGLRSIAGRGGLAAISLVAVGELNAQGHIFVSRDSGTTFKPVYTANKPLYGVCLDTDGTIYAVGAAGTVLRGSIGTGSFVPEPLAGETADLRAVWCQDGLAVAVGAETSRVRIP